MAQFPTCCSQLCSAIESFQSFQRAFHPAQDKSLDFGWIWIPIQSKLGFANHANELETLSKTDIKTCKGQLPQINFEALLTQKWCYIPCTVVPFCSSTIVLSSTLHEACASFSHTHDSVENGVVFERKLQLLEMHSCFTEP